MQDTNLVRYIMKHDGIAPAELAVHLGVKERATRLTVCPPRPRSV